VPVTYVDFRVAPIEGAEYISEFTWANESNSGLVMHHYFVDFPGAKDLERQIIDAVGGSPLVRYSCPTILRAFIDSIPVGHIIAFRTIKQKQLVVALLYASKIDTDKAFCIFDDVDAGDGELEVVMDNIRQTRTEASSRFGNAV